jgi:hypothetical protein
MNAQILAFDAAQNQGSDRLHPLPNPAHDPVPTPLPEREWGLSAPQVVAVVAAIVAISEVIGLLF